MLGFHTLYMKWGTDNHFGWPILVDVISKQFGTVYFDRPSKIA